MLATDTEARDEVSERAVRYNPPSVEAMLIV